jgi:hypothetical protein
VLDANGCLYDHPSLADIRICRLFGERPDTEQQPDPAVGVLL